MIAINNAIAACRARGDGDSVKLLSDLGIERAALLARVAELAGALAPFAALLHDHHDRLPNDRIIYAINSSNITAGDLRAARKAVQS